MSNDQIPSSAATVHSTAAPPVPRSQRLRTLGGWGFLLVLIIVGVLVSIQVLPQSQEEREALDPEGVGDTGARALAEILRDQGVEVEVFRSRTAARDAITDDSTLVMANPYSLTDDGLTTLIAPADRVVFLSSSTHLLHVLEIGSPAAYDAAEADASCRVQEFAEIGAVRPDRHFTPAAGVEGCFGRNDGYGVLVAENKGTTQIVVGGDRLFSNAYLTDDGNAALGLALLGQTKHVVWYVPSLADSDIEGESVDTLGSLAPSWLTPAIVLLMVSGVTAALWRGRRFGPLVAETLPVTVRASETMHGRARLTAKAGDTAHAAEALREGSRRRIARRLGLNVRASANAVADAAADRLRAPRGSLQSLLDGPLPSDDTSLIELARRLSELEASLNRSP